MAHPGTTDISLPPSEAGVHGVARDYVVSLATSGRYHFTTSQAVRAIGSARSAVRGQLRRLKVRGELAEPVRGFHVIVPFEHRARGCLPAEQFIPQLMDRAGEPYYFALLSAAEKCGAAHQRPQVAQVMVRRNRAPIRCGQVRVEFVARHDLDHGFATEVNTPRGVARYATPEITALELVGYPRHGGGIGNVTTVLRDLAEEIDADRLTRAARACPVAWSQRLGYLLARLGGSRFADALAPFVRQHGKSYTPLRRAAPTVGASRDPTWRLIVNADPEPDE